jgi:hypothetical protein
MPLLLALAILLLAVAVIHRATERVPQLPRAVGDWGFGSSNDPRIAMAGVSRAYPVHTDMRHCMRDEGVPFETGSQVQVSSHRKLLPSKAVVVSVAEKLGRDPGRQG